MHGLLHHTKANEKRSFEKKNYVSMTYNDISWTQQPIMRSQKTNIGNIIPRKNRQQQISLEKKVPQLNYLIYLHENVYP